jgi:hypothetical protein
MLAKKWQTNALLPAWQRAPFMVAVRLPFCSASLEQLEPLLAAISKVSLQNSPLLQPRATGEGGKGSAGGDCSDGGGNSSGRWLNSSLIPGSGNGNGGGGGLNSPQTAVVGPAQLEGPGGMEQRMQMGCGAGGGAGGGDGNLFRMDGGR